MQKPLITNIGKQSSNIINNINFDKNSLNCGWIFLTLILNIAPLANNINFTRYKFDFITTYDTMKLNFIFRHYAFERNAFDFVKIIEYMFHVIIMVVVSEYRRCYIDIYIRRIKYIVWTFSI